MRNEDLCVDGGWAESRKSLTFPFDFCCVWLILLSLQTNFLLLCSLLKTIGLLGIGIWEKLNSSVARPLAVLRSIFNPLSQKAYKIHRWKIEMKSIKKIQHCNSFAILFTFHENVCESTRFTHTLICFNFSLLLVYCSLNYLSYRWRKKRNAAESSLEFFSIVIDDSIFNWLTLSSFVIIARVTVYFCHFPFRRPARRLNLLIATNWPFWFM